MSSRTCQGNYLRELGRSGNSSQSPRRGWDSLPRYVEDPTPDIEIRAMISQETWKKFIAACSAAQGVSLNDEACMEMAVDILNKGMQSFIEQHSK